MAESADVAFRDISSMLPAAVVPLSCIQADAVSLSASICDRTSDATSCIC